MHPRFGAALRTCSRGGLPGAATARCRTLCSALSQFLGQGLFTAPPDTSVLDGPLFLLCLRLASAACGVISPLSFGLLRHSSNRRAPGQIHAPAGRSVYYYRRGGGALRRGKAGIWALSTSLFHPESSSRSINRKSKSTLESSSSGGGGSVLSSVRGSYADGLGVGRDPGVGLPAGGGVSGQRGRRGNGGTSGLRRAPRRRRW